MSGSPTRRRPSSLDLRYFRFPIGSIVSIAHRFSGIMLVLAIPLALYVLQETLAGPQRFDAITARLGHGAIRVSVAALALLFLHHLIAGIRHLLLDLHIGISRRSSRLSAWTVVTAMAVAMLFAVVNLL